MKDETQLDPEAITDPVMKAKYVDALRENARMTGGGKLVVGDVTQAYSKRMFAPLVFFRNGNLSVIVNGNLDGDATLIRMRGETVARCHV